MKYLVPAIRFKIFMTVLLGLLYPFAMTGLGQVFFPRQASGDFLKRGGVVVGSTLIAQKFEGPDYFWPRPSAVDYNPLSSGGSNLGPTSQDLKKAVDERRAKIKAAHAEQTQEPPQELLFASASGLDPHVSPETLIYQAQRVAKARKLSVERVQQLIEKTTEGRQLGVLGEVTVNVLALNLALDKEQGLESAPTLRPVPPPAAESAGSPASIDAK